MSDNIEDTEWVAIQTDLPPHALCRDYLDPVFYEIRDDSGEGRTIGYVNNFPDAVRIEAIPLMIKALQAAIHELEKDNDSDNWYTLGLISAALQKADWRRR